MYECLNQRGTIIVRILFAERSEKTCATEECFLSKEKFFVDSSKSIAIAVALEKVFVLRWGLDKILMVCVFDYCQEKLKA